MTRFRPTSAGADPPGAPGLTRGAMLASTRGFVLGVAVVVGSATGAPVYRKMALLRPGSAEEIIISLD